MNDDFSLSCVELIDACIRGGSRAAKGYIINNDVVKRMYALGACVDGLGDSLGVYSVGVNVADHLGIDVDVVLPELSIVNGYNDDVIDMLRIPDAISIDRDDECMLVLSLNFKDVWNKAL